MRTFIEQLLHDAESVAYPSDLEQEAGSLAVNYNGALIVLDISTAYTYIARIRVAKVYAGQGYGSAALCWLCKLADHHRVRLHLYVRAKDHKYLDTENLTAWYRRHGFIKRSVWMVRSPRR
jgi:GNAT superfamily N-acetyltransferase